MPEGQTCVLATSRIVARDAAGVARHLVVVIDDITERKKSEQRIAFMAHHDVLTGLANRLSIMDKIEEAVARHRRRGDSFAVLLLDLDRFKHVNDTLGHAVGDALLRETAVRLKASLRETDVLARLGGDEFAIIQDNDDNQREAASALADRIIDIISKPFDIDGNEVNIATSIGIALAPEHATSSDSLMKMADLALYRAKSAGRNRHCFFDPEMSLAASARHELESELRRAIQNNELELHYQPIVDTQTLRICGAEALIRWRHPTKGVILPDQFIPLAEETGMIAQMGEWLMQTACAEAATWPIGVKVSVNLSAVQFRKNNLVDIVICALAQSGLPPERLELEITETALIEVGNRMSADFAAVQKSGHCDHARRFRHRIFVAKPVADVSVRQDQGRQVVHAKFDQADGMRRHHCGDAHARAQPRYRDHCGRRRNRGPVPAVAPCRRYIVAGLPVPGAVFAVGN